MQLYTLKLYLYIAHYKAMISFKLDVRMRELRSCNCSYTYSVGLQVWQFLLQKIRQVIFCRVVTEIFLLFYRHKTFNYFQEKIEMLKRRLGTSPYFTTRQPLLLPPKSLAQLLIFPTF